MRRRSRGHECSTLCATVHTSLKYLQVRFVSRLCLSGVFSWSSVHTHTTCQTSEIRDGTIHDSYAAAANMLKPAGGTGRFRMDHLGGNTRVSRMHLTFLGTDGTTLARRVCSTLCYFLLSFLWGSRAEPRPENDALLEN